MTNSAFIKTNSETFFSKPECVVYDEVNQCLYISNINGSPSKKDGNGFISKTSMKGDIIELHWIDNLNAPKGMFIKNDILYCTDISELLLINIDSKEIIKRISIPNAEFLNDIIVTNENLIIITDSKKNTIFVINKNDIYQSTITLKGANGIFYFGEKVFLGANGNINIYHLDTDSIEIVYEGIGNIDGLIVSDNRIFFSNYFSKLSVLENGIIRDIDKGVSFIDCKTDFCQLEDGTIVVPDFHSRLLFYKEKISQ